MHKAFYITAWIGILLALGLMILTAFWLIYPYQPVTFNTQPMHVDKEVYHPHEYVTITVDFCKNTTVIPTITRQFVDGLIYDIPKTLAVPKGEGCQTREVQIFIPSSLPPGVYHIASQYTYKVNPVREVTVTVDTDKFTVAK